MGRGGWKIVRRHCAGVEVVDREDGEDNSCQVITSRNLVDNRPDYMVKVLSVRFFMALTKLTR